MNKLKPFMFWIVCGVLVLLGIVSLFFITNSPSGSDGRDPVEINTDLDKRFKDLKKQYDLANGPGGHSTPVDVFDPTDLNPDHPNSFKHLLDEYLPTKQWKVVLDDYVAKDKAMADAIAQWLVTRSQPLHVSIFSESDLSEWYQAHYLVQTHDLIQQLSDAKAIDLPDTKPAAGAPLAAGTDAPDDTDPLSTAAARQVAGFFTRGNDLPATVNAAGGASLLTLRLHIMEQVVAALVKASATNIANPLLPNKVQHEDKARLVSIEWQSVVAPPALPMTAMPGASVSPASNFTRYPLHLTVEGPISAVLAVEAILEGNPVETLPIMVVTGGSLSRKATYAAGDRTGVPCESVTGRFDLAILDYSGVAVASGPATTAPAGAPGGMAPGGAPAMNPGGAPAMNPGMNPGMNSAPGGPPPGAPGMQNPGQRPTGVPNAPGAGAPLNPGTRPGGTP